MIHNGVACKMCGIESIKGCLYTCLECPDFMACETCEKSRTHEHSLFEITSKLSNNTKPESQIHYANKTEDFSLKALVLGTIRLSASAENRKLPRP